MCVCVCVWAGLESMAMSRLTRTMVTKKKLAKRICARVIVIEEEKEERRQKGKGGGEIRNVRKRGRETES